MSALYSLSAAPAPPSFVLVCTPCPCCRASTPARSLCPCGVFVGDPRHDSVSAEREARIRIEMTKRVRELEQQRQWQLEQRRQWQLEQQRQQQRQQREREAIVREEERRLRRARKDEERRLQRRLARQREKEAARRQKEERIRAIIRAEKEREQRRVEAERLQRRREEERKAKRAHDDSLLVNILTEVERRRARREALGMEMAEREARAYAGEINAIKKATWAHVLRVFCELTVFSKKKAARHLVPFKTGVMDVLIQRYPEVNWRLASLIGVIMSSYGAPAVVRGDPTNVLNPAEGLQGAGFVLKSLHAIINSADEDVCWGLLIEMTAAILHMDGLGMVGLLMTKALQASVSSLIHAKRGGGVILPMGQNFR